MISSFGQPYNHLLIKIKIQLQKYRKKKLNQGKNALQKNYKKLKNISIVGILPFTRNINYIKQYTGRYSTIYHCWHSTKMRMILSALIESLKRVIIIQVNQSRQFYAGGDEIDQIQYNFYTHFPTKMQEKESLNDFFKNRAPQSITPPKMVKKLKSSIINQDDIDPIQKILGWRDSIKLPEKPDEQTFRLREVASIIKDDPEQWGSDFEGILIDVDWDTLSFQQFSQLKLPTQLIDNGIVFIWGSNSNIGQLFDYFSVQGFQYVENFMFVMLDRKKIPLQRKENKSKNTLLNYFKKIETSKDKQKQTQPKIVKDYEINKAQRPQQIFSNLESDYFQQSQRVLYLFRKPNKNKILQLRHQRTSDAFFTIGDSFKLDLKSMENVYKMIQTLLIKANYKEGKALKLLELWGSKERIRKGWVTVRQKQNNENIELN